VIASLKPYAAMKDSGLSWLGDVPEHWEVVRTKILLRERVQKGFPEEPLLAATQTKGVVRKDKYESRTVLAMKDLHLLKLVRVGDFVISLRSFQGGIEYAREQGIISPAYTVLYPIHTENHGFLAWLFKSKPYIENLSLYVTGIRQGQTIEYDRLGRSQLAIPPPTEQGPIVRFLDYSNRRIGRYIHTKQKLIKMLEEQRRAIIHRVVTRGLDTDVGLQPSGVPWLGNVPERWDVSRVKNEFVCLNRHRVPLSATERGAMTLRLYDYYGASRVIDRVDTYIFDDELLLIAEDGANLVLRNLPLAVIARGRFWVNNHAHILKPRRGNLEYLASLMESLNYLPWISGAAQPKLTKDRLLSIAIAVPPRDEQDRIVAWLDAETGPWKRAISRARREIDILREYSARLIADAVSGKLDVREVAAKLPEEPAELPRDDGVEIADLVSHLDDEDAEGELQEVEA
jgi:type I restriction enzyme S subunit